MPDKPSIRLWAAVALAGCWLIAVGAGHAHEPGRDPGRASGGTVTQRAPAGAPVASNAAELRSMLEAADGPAEIWLGPGTHTGQFTIRRSLALHGETGAILDGAGYGTVLTIEAASVLVDNLVIRHSGRRNTAEDAGIRAKGSGIRIRNVRVQDALFGITLGPCPRCVVERCHVHGDGPQAELKGDGIKLWESNDAVVRDSLVEGVRDVVVWYSRRVLLEGNTVRNSRYGSHFMYAHDSIVRHSRIVDNVVGIFVMYSSRLHVENNVLAGARGAAGVGLGFKESDGVQVSGNWFVANTTGTYLDETPSSPLQPVHFVDNLFALNDVALRLHGVGNGLSFTQNEFRDNALLADVEGGSDAMSVEFMHNQYSDYAGYDLNADGTGDVAYQLKRLSGAMLDAHPTLAFFEGTAASGLLDVIARAAPVFSSRLLLVDPQPSMRRRPL